MNTTTNTTCSHTELFVSGGVVRCSECLSFFHNHKDSDPRPGLVSSNQER